MQLSRASHIIDGGDADQWRAIPSDDRISLDLAPGGQPSTESGDGGTHRLCPAQQSAPDQKSIRYHLSYSQALEMSLDVPLPLLTFRTDLHFALPH